MADIIVLTGITGFIAKHIALLALERGHHVQGTLRDLSRADEVRAALTPHLTDPEALQRLSFHAADLTGDAGWPQAMAGATALIHTASPFPLSMPRDEQALIRPAVEGTSRVLRSARAAGITRAVLTSSTVAVIDESVDRIYDESDWCKTSLPTTSAYAKSKTLAEQRAWEIAEDHGMQLTTINPGMVWGPPLDRHYGSSLALVERLMKGKDPMLPDFGFPEVDVRDVAEMHLRALERPSTAGKRYLAAGGTLGMIEMGRLLKETYPDRRIPTRAAPRPVLWLLSLFDPAVRGILPKLGRMEKVTTLAAQRDLGITFRPASEALQASAAWLVANERV